LASTSHWIELGGYQETTQVATWIQDQIRKVGVEAVAEIQLPRSKTKDKPRALIFVPPRLETGTVRKLLQDDESDDSKRDTKIWVFGTEIPPAQYANAPVLDEVNFLADSTKLVMEEKGERMFSHHLMQAMRIIFGRLWDSDTFVFHDPDNLERVSWNLHLVKTEPSVVEGMLNFKAQRPPFGQPFARTLAPMIYPMAIVKRPAADGTDERDPEELGVHDLHVRQFPDKRFHYTPEELLVEGMHAQFQAIYAIDSHSRISIKNCELSPFYLTPAIAYRVNKSRSY
jgi:hypothetical protein